MKVPFLATCRCNQSTHAYSLPLSLSLSFFHHHYYHQNCTKGRYSGSTGSSTCVDCAEGYFANSAGSVSCLKCSSEAGYGYGPQYTSPAGSATCSECVKDSYMADNGKCKSKDEGIVAEEEGTTLETLELEESWYRFSRTATAIYACTR